jgi:hypothetical protein
MVEGSVSDREDVVVEVDIVQADEFTDHDRKFITRG